MSRIGKKPIAIPNGAKAVYENNILKVTGPKGELVLNIPGEIMVSIGEKEVKVDVKNPREKKNRALWGTIARIIFNMFEGVTRGYSKSLELVGTGFKTAVSGDEITLDIGFSHPVKYKLPKGVSATVAKNIITVAGIDKALVGDVAAGIRRLRKPEPYKGKGIRYVGEVIRRKAGKSAKTTTA